MDNEEMTLYDLRVTVCEIKGRSVCGMKEGDYFEVRNSDQLTLPDGQAFCYWAIQSVLPMLPAKMRRLPAADWLEQDTMACCPDPGEGLLMRIDRIGEVTMRTADLT
ncbi:MULTISPECIES: TIGR04076 family protein [unclassified Rhodococcus (in: high G+C Gram-positive bacteria)]|uniref:TIGR04076 family protein n=1 Tax=unclassified Rhodococcus (in: high G+C Gram-positive bacteria) TaxID=192944 RepID=UPI00096AB10B|nr:MULTISPECIES: TIGR04076 family protein [unclassified Rhodococcus (in: high G+C Gram-positive bacteria)]